MIIDFRQISYDEKPTLILRNLDGTAIQTLGYAFDIQLDLSYNEVSELTFSLPQYVDGTETPHYGDVVGMRIVDLRGVGQFILVDPTIESDGIAAVKSCKAYSLEYEFAKKDFFIESGTYNFWNPVTPGDTIIGRILEKMPDWTIGSIDDRLVGKYRTFDDTNDKLYNFMKSNVQESYGCIFTFDTYQRRIYVRSADTAVAQREVYLSPERMLEKIDVDEDSDSIVTCLDVNGAEGVTIRSVNPIGTNKIYNLDYFMTEANFSPELIAKWRAWEAAVEAQRLPYYNLTIEYNLRISELLTEEAAVTDLQGELTSLLNQQAVIIQAISLGIRTQADLNIVNSQIAAKRSQVSTRQAYCDAVQAEAQSLYNALAEINKQLAFDYQENGSYVYFTPSELAVLRRYFIEDSFEDSTFTAATAATYSNEDLNSSVANASLTITGGTTTPVTTAGSNTITSVKGGTLTISTLTASVIDATVEVTTDGRVVFSAYLNKGTVGEASFESGTLTLTGDGSVQISQSSVSVSVTSGRLYFTKNTTEYELHSIEWDLIEYGRQVLSEKASPTYNFSVDSGNFLALEDFTAFKNQFNLGERVYLNIGDGDILTPYVVGVHINYEDPSDFSLEFSSAYTSFDRSFSMAKMLEQSVSMGKSLDIKGGKYGEFVSSGASTEVRRFMDSALDLAKNAVLSQGDQAISIDDSGIWIRKWADGTKTDYDDKQIRMVDNMIVFTENGWNTASMAIGEIFDENLRGSYFPTKDLARDTSKTYYIYNPATGTYTPWDGSTPWSTSLYELNSTGTAYGIAAPYLVGTMLAGENLVIDTTNGAFKVDSSGVFIDSLKFYITHGGSSYDQTLEEALAETGTTTYSQDSEPANPTEGDLWYNTAQGATIQRHVRVGDDLSGVTLTFDDSIVPENVGGDVIVGAPESAGRFYSEENLQTETPAYPSFYYDIDGVIGTLNMDNTWSTQTFTVPASFGVVSEIDATNPFYRATYGTFANDYQSDKWYRYNGSSWELVEDGDISLLNADMTAVENAIKGMTTDGTLTGLIDASRMAGIIDAQEAQMKSASGNVLFDADGMWLLNQTTKEQSTKAIWMNESGILIGERTLASDPWTFQTAINYDGIVAESIAAGDLSGMRIYGGEIHIGPKPTSGYYFNVDSRGNLTAETGTFSGTVKGASFVDGSDQPMMNQDYKFTADYLELKGLTIINDNLQTTLRIDSNGNVHLGAGSVIDYGVDMSGNAQIQEIQNDITTKTTSYYQNTYPTEASIGDLWTVSGNVDVTYGMYTYVAGNTYRYAGFGAWDMVSDVNPSYITKTRITQTTIMSPSVYGGRMVGGSYYSVGQGYSDGPAYYICDGYTVDSGTGEIYPGFVAGYISYDNNGAGTVEEARERVIFASRYNMPIKIQSASNISIAANNGTSNIYMVANTVDMSNSLAVRGNVGIMGQLSIGSAQYGTAAMRPVSATAGQLYFQYI